MRLLALMSILYTAIINNIHLYWHPRVKDDQK